MKKIFLILCLICTNCYSASWQCIGHWMAICHTWRMQVPTGWVVASEGYNSGEYALTFVPDELHKWEG